MRHSLLLFLRANARHLAELGVAGALVNLLGLALPLFTMLVYDKAVGNEVHDTLLALTGGLCLLLLLELTLRWSRVVLVEHAGSRWDARLDERLLLGILGTPAARALPVGEVLARHREVAATRDVLAAGFLLPLLDLPFALLFGLALWVIGGPVMLCLPLAMGLVLTLLGSALQAASRHRQRRANQLVAQKVSQLADVLAARDSLGPAAAAQAVLQRFRAPAAEGARASARARLWAAQSQQLTIVGLSAATMVMLVAGVFMVEAQALSVGGLISCVQLGSRLLGLLCGLAPVVTRWADFAAALRGLGQTVDLGRPLHGRGAADPSALGTGALASEGIRLDNLSAHYPGHSRPVLDGLNLHLQSGALVAVVGASGSGKSSLLRLLAGQLGHASGQLSCAGHVIDSDSQRLRLARSVGYKPQEPCFVGGTLAQVVAPGEHQPDEAALVAALQAAGLGPALERGELGLDSAVGTNGAGISGGQRQMLLLARLLHARPDILLLDEPTLGLDRSAQDGLMAALRRLAPGRCVLVATHATDVIQAADRVLVLDRGRLVADSTPARLLNPGAAQPPNPSANTPANPSANRPAATPTATASPASPTTPSDASAEPALAV